MTPDSGVDATVVIPAYNERATIESTLDALHGQEANVIVVVGGDDGTETVTRAHPATNRVIEDTTENGPAGARNKGARAAETSVVCFTDADTIVPPEWVGQHLSHYHDPSVIGVGGPLQPLDGDWTDDVLFKLLSDWWYRVSWPIGFVQASGNNCSYRREPFLDAGGFDESMSFVEDTDCSLRMHNRGKMVYDPDTVVETSPRRQKGDGYLPLFLTYALGYTRYALGYDPGEEYFQSQ